MKKRILFLSLFFAFAVSFGQTFKGTVYGGFVASQVSGDDFSGFHKPGFSAGLQSVYRLNERNTLSLSVAFMQKGSRHMPSKTNFSRYILRLNYVEVPLVYSFTVGNNLWMDLGAAYARLVSSKEEFDYLENTEDAFYNTEIDLVLGLRRTLSEKLDIGLRLHNSSPFTPVRDHSSGTRLWYNWGQYNTALVLMLYYNFD